ncbi:hypothetical protein WG66_015554 [Moniliophthora roreri]|nr:hypothetical protein WG66_015554 [Moniliophthora roreri]
MRFEQAPFYVGVVTVALSVGYFAGSRSSKLRDQIEPVPTKIKEELSREDEASDSESEISSVAGDQDLSSVELLPEDECKLVLVVRSDLGMSTGKIAAQLATRLKPVIQADVSGLGAQKTCYLGMLQNLTSFQHSGVKALGKVWARQTKVALRCSNEEELLTLQAQAQSLNLCARSIQDAWVNVTCLVVVGIYILGRGRTQIAAGSRTVLGILGRYISRSPTLSSDMSSQAYPHNPSNMNRPQYNHPPHDPYNQDDSKPPFDDLIDEYSKPYAAHSGHQTYAVNTSPSMSPPEHRRGPSYPLASKPHFYKNSEDSTPELGAVEYPPKSHIKDVDDRPLWKKILPESLACRLFVLTVLIETTVDLAIEGELLVRVQAEEDSTNRRMPVYLTIFALAHVFQFIMAVDAVYARNTLQFIFLTMFNALFLVYAIIQISEIRDAVNANSEGAGITSIPVNVLTAIIPVVIAVSEIAYIALGWKIYDEFGWKVYKFLGADRRIKKMYANYQIYECLVKFDVFFWAGFSVQFIWLVLNKADWEYYVTCAALPLSLVLLIEGHLAARHENKWMMATFMSGCVSAMVYFVYKLVKVLMYKDKPEFSRIWGTLTVFSVIAIVLLFATFIFSVLVMRKFGCGLKNSLKRKNAHQRFGSRPLNGPASANPNRMSID